MIKLSGSATTKKFGKCEYDVTNCTDDKMTVKVKRSGILYEFNYDITNDTHPPDADETMKQQQQPKRKYIKCTGIHPETGIKCNFSQLLDNSRRNGFYHKHEYQEDIVGMLQKEAGDDNEQQKCIIDLEIAKIMACSNISFANAKHLYHLAKTSFEFGQKHPDASYKDFVPKWSRLGLISIMNELKEEIQNEELNLIKQAGAVTIILDESKIIHSNIVDIALLPANHTSEPLLYKAVSMNECTKESYMNLVAKVIESMPEGTRVLGCVGDSLPTQVGALGHYSNNSLFSNGSHSDKVFIPCMCHMVNNSLKNGIELSDNLSAIKLSLESFVRQIRTSKYAKILRSFCSTMTDTRWICDLGIIQWIYKHINLIEDLQDDTFVLSPSILYYGILLEPLRDLINIFETTRTSFVQSKELIDSTCAELISLSKNDKLPNDIQNDAKILAYTLQIKFITSPIYSLALFASSLTRNGKKIIFDHSTILDFSDSILRKKDESKSLLRFLDEHESLHEELQNSPLLTEESDFFESSSDSEYIEPSEEELEICSKIIDHIVTSDVSEELSEEEKMQIIEESIEEAEIHDSDFLNDTASIQEDKITKIVTILKNSCCFKKHLPINENPDIQSNLENEETKGSAYAVTSVIRCHDRPTVFAAFERFYLEISEKISASFYLIMENEIHECCARNNLNQSENDNAYQAYISYMTQVDELLLKSSENQTFMIRWGILNMSFPKIRNNLYLFAHHLFSLPCSEACVERYFSVQKWLIHPKRNRIDENVKESITLICLASKELINTAMLNHLKHKKS